MAGFVRQHSRRLLDGKVRCLTAMDGAMASRRQGTAQRLLDGEGRRDGSSTAKDGARRLLDGKGRRKHGGDGPRAQWRWAAMDSAMANGR